MKRLLTRLALFLALCLLLAAPAWAAELNVAAAASLTNALTAAKGPFEAKNPGTSLVMNFAASGALFSQMEQGAPADVFLSADQKWMDKAAAAKLIDPATRKDFAQNALVLAVPADNPAKVKTLDDLKGATVTRIAVGTPKTVPAGAYTEKALTPSGLWAALTPKLIFGESVRQVLDYLMRAEVDAGFVYATDAKQGGEKVKIIAEVPLPEPVSYPAAVLAASTQKKLAQAYVDFLLSDEGQAVLATFGFKKP